MPVTVADIRAKISVDGVDKAQKGLKGVNDEVDKAPSKWSSASATLAGFSSKATDIGGKLSALLTLPLIGVGIAASHVSMEFGAAMGNIQSLAPGATAQVNALKGSIQQTAIEVGANTTDIANGAYQVISAFGLGADTAKILEVNAKAAAAGVAQTSDAIALTSAVTKAYGDTSAKAVQHASDLALLTVRLGQTTFPELASSIGQVTALSSNLNISQAQLFATFASTSGVIGTSAQVATDMKGAMQALLAPTGAMSDLFKKVGVTSGEALIKQDGFAGAMQKIVDYAKATHQPLQSLIGSIEGQQIALSLAGPQGKAYADALKQMGNASGATDAAFAAQTSGVNKAGFAWSQAQAKIQVFLENLGDKLAPLVTKGTDALGPMLDFVSRLIDGFSNLSSPVQVVIGVLGGLLAAAGPILVVAGQLAGAISGVAGAFGAEGALAGVTGMLGPIGLVIAGIVALVAAIALVATHWQQISAAIQSNDIFQLLATKIFPAIVSAVQDLGFTIASQVQPILAQLQTTLRTQLMPAWQGLQQAFETAKPVLAVIGAIIGGVLVIALGLLIGVLKGVFSALGPILSGVIAVFGGVVQIISGVIQTIVGIFQILVGLVKGIFTGDWTTLGDGLNSLKNGVLNILGGLWSAVVGIFQGLVGGVVGLVSGLVSGVIGFFQNLWEKIVGHSIVPDLVNDVLTWINNLVTTFLTFIGGLVVRGIAFFLALGSGILAAVNSMVNLVLKYVDLWISEFVARINLMISLARAIFNGIISVITSPFITAKNTVLGIIDDIKGFISGLHLNFPQIHMPPLPHFSLTGDFSINPPSVPHLDVKWYAQGGIAGLHGPEMIGVGDAGPEAVIPLNRLGGGASASGGGGVIEIHIHTDLDGQALAHKTIRYTLSEIYRELGRHGVRY